METLNEEINRIKTIMGILVENKDLVHKMGMSDWNQIGEVLRDTKKVKQIHQYLVDTFKLGCIYGVSIVYRKIN